VIAGLFAVTLPGFLLGALFMALANRRVTAEVAHGRWVKLGVFFVIVHVVLVVALAGRAWVTTLVVVILAASGRELWGAWQSMPSPRPARTWLVFGLVAVLVVFVSLRLPPTLFAFLFLVTAACDGFSQVTGQLIGQRRLVPNLSPGKTVNGLIGGLVAAVAVALLTRGLLGIPRPATVVAIALLTGLAGLAGDLAASWVKRQAGIKDYSSALPGQGGFLDRFDSLLGALALIGPALAMAV
jgi:phosphatidate cytidylyltransferase